MSWLAMPRFLWAEVLKYRRSRLLTFMLGGPLVLVALVGILFGIYGPQLTAEGLPPWEALFEFSYRVMGTWFLALCIALQAALVHGLEHASQGWRQLYSQPIPRGMIYWGKAAFLILVLAGTLALFYGLILLVGALLQVGLPKLGFQQDRTPLLGYLIFLVRVLLAALPLLAWHHWLAFRYRSFGLSVGVGLLGTLSVFILLAGWQGIRYYPYAYVPLMLAAGMNDNRLFFTSSVVWGMGLGMLFYLLGYMQQARKDIA